MFVRAICRLCLLLLLPPSPLLLLNISADVVSLASYNAFADYYWNCFKFITKIIIQFYVYVPFAARNLIRPTNTNRFDSIRFRIGDKQNERNCVIIVQICFNMNSTQTWTTIDSNIISMCKFMAAIVIDFSIMVNNRIYNESKQLFSFSFDKCG